jgi:hypothetical protein
MRPKSATAIRKNAQQGADGIDESLIEWMLSLSPRQRLEVLERQRKIVRARRRAPSGR